MTPRLELVADEARCTVLPDLGGSLGGWWLGNRPVLRPASEAAIAAADPTGLSAFPLVPFSNRIGHARFVRDGKPVVLRPNRHDEAHALHGIGWQRPWRVAQHGIDRTSLVLDHAGDDFWPWPFRCRQEVTLEPRRLIVELAVTNLAPVTVPLSAGYHPYFCRDHAELSLMARAVWLIDPNQLPARSVMPTGHLDLSRRAPLGGRSIDNCYDGVSWPARIAWPRRGMAVSIAGSAALGSAVVYADAAADALCVEPVANSSNALNLDGDFLAMPEIAPQATLTVRCVMQIEDLEQG